MIYIIIPVHNRKEFTRDCLESLRRQTYKSFVVVLVDDGSTDGTVEMVEKMFPEVKILSGDGTLFWTASINLGIRYALENNAEFILTLNNDTIAFDDFLEKMIYWAKKTPGALLGALAIDHQTKKPVYGGSIINWKINKTMNLIDHVNPLQQKGLHEVTHYPGRGLLVPAYIFTKIGLFDEIALPHYYADYDFTHLAIRKGFKVFSNYDAKLYIYPEESGDFANRKKKSLRNYKNHLFSIKGGGNLKNFTKYTFRNCPTFYVPIFLLIGYFRRIFGYLIK